MGSVGGWDFVVDVGLGRMTFLEDGHFPNLCTLTRYRIYKFIRTSQIEKKATANTVVCDTVLPMIVLDLLNGVI